MSQCPPQYHPPPSEEQVKRGERWRAFLDEVLRARDERTPTSVCDEAEDDQ